MVGRQAPSQLPSRNTYRDDYYALIINGKKNPSVPLDMGRYGAYAPHTVEYQIYRGEATDSCGCGSGLSVIHEHVFFLLLLTLSRLSRLDTD